MPAVTGDQLSDDDLFSYLDARTPRERGVLPCIVELFLEFWDDANDEDRHTIYDIIRRYAEKRRW